MTGHDDAYWDARIAEITRKAAEDAVGFYYEKLQDDLAHISEAGDFITSMLNTMPSREEFDDLAIDAQLNRLNGVEVNKDIGRHKALIAQLDKRIGQLEHA
jgi:hypothetical protein